MRPLGLTASTTALIIVDLQNGLLGRQLAPHSSRAVVENAVRLAHAFMAQGGTVIRISMDFSDLPRQAVDRSSTLPEGLPAEFFEFAPEVAALDGIVVTKRKWGSFHGTELDLLLRRRKIEGIVVCGIATNFGVESTVREAWQHGYAVVVAEDACSSLSVELHDFAVTKIFPAIARVRSTAEIEVEILTP
jgi:nicotinamidase-related amidase